MCRDTEGAINNNKQLNNGTSLVACAYLTTLSTATSSSTFVLTLSSAPSSPSSSSSLIVRPIVPRSGLQWKIIISSILLLLCQISHVLAIRKGRLMSPSSFTALSGDLHVQIQFSADEAVASLKPGTTAYMIPTTTTTATMTTTSGTGIEQATTRGESSSTGSGVENTITTTLVISKYVDLPSSLSASSSAASSVSSSSAEMMSAAGNFDSPIANASYEQILQRKRKEIVQNIPLYPDPRHNVTQIAVPCQTFTQGGLYEMQVVTNLKTTMPQVSVNDVNNNHSNKNDIILKNTNRKNYKNPSAPTPTVTTTTLMPVSDERLRQTLDVRWPAAEMHVSPVLLKTYPQAPVAVELRFPEVNCDRAWLSHNLPEFWLELIYCGKEHDCARQQPQNISKSAILYAEQIRGYPKKKTLTLGCELFGLAGNYAVQLRPMLAAAWQVPVTRRFLSVDWSDKFVFNVYARSIFPCDPHTGIGVLYEYPACILEQGDRVRVYAKLRADVASLKPPTSLHYVAEQRVVKSQYSLYFSCDLFSEKYVEYCFVYVSQAISGAVADVRMDCVPTLPVRDSDTGGWGPWSEWTPCSTNCLGGTRNRYRFCDSPPPRYGAKFCEGPSVETQKCGQTIGDTWDCIYESSGSLAANVNRTEVSQEIGPGCRCGCIVHLGSSKPKRLIAGATQSCPGRSFWLLQVDGQETIRLTLNFLRLPCASQYIKVRDGPSLSSTLLIELRGGNNLMLPAELESTGAQLLVEFYADDEAASSNHHNNNNSHNNNNNIYNKYSNNNNNSSKNNNSNFERKEAAASSLQNSSRSGVANLGCTGGFLANVQQQIDKNTSAQPTTTRIASVKSRVVVQQVQRLRSRFTLVHLSAVVFASIIILISALLGAQYVLRYRKYHLAVARRRDQGSRLHTPRASQSSLHQPPSRAISTTTLISEVIYLVKMRPKHQLRHSILRESIDAEALARETDFNDATGGSLARVSKCDDASCSSGSIATLRNAPIATLTHNDNELGSRSGTLTRQDSAKDSDSFISSGMSSLCNSPPLHLKRASRYSERYDAATLKLRAADDSAPDGESPRSSCIRDYERLGQLQLVGAGRSASVSLTNGCYSPAASIVSTATVRTTTTSTNPKESKEKQNRKKLLARPGSEFSLSNQEELELDYYDYNVNNAGATPGSYLGMDPAYLIWIPPFDDVIDGSIEEEEPEEDATRKAHATAAPEEEPLYEEIKMPRYGHYLSPGSNTETGSTVSTCDEFSPLSSQQQSKASSPSETHNLKNCLIQKVMGKSRSSVSSRPATPRLTRKQRRAAKKHCQSTLSLRTETEAGETLALHELSGTKSARSIAARRTATTPSPDEQSDSYVEKETAVVKSPSDLQDFLALDDIQFADESESSEHDPELKRRQQQQHLTLVQQKQQTVKRGCMAASSSGMREVTV